MSQRGQQQAPYGVVSSAQFESGPPATQIYTDEDGEVFETVKEEEVIHKKRKATTTTRNIERRTQRDLLLEDGAVIGDTGPVVTEDVTEDTQVKETFADENLRPEGQSDALALPPPGEGWVAVPGCLVTSEKVQKTVTSHTEQQNTRETEQEGYYGDVTNEEVEKYKGSVGRLALAAEERRKAGGGKELARLSEPRLVSESNRNWGVVDTEDLKETSRIKDGHVVTETHRTTQQEQFDHASAPDSGSSISDGSVHEEGHRAAHHLIHTKDEDILEYYAVPKGGTLAQGVKLGEGMHVVSEDVQEDREGDALEDVGATFFLRHKLPQRTGTGVAAGVVSPTPREDALTKKPLDYVKEERQRQHETTRWLEHHFGSDSGRSRGSDDEKTGGNLIKITMSPHPVTPPSTPPADGRLRRWGNLTSTPVNAKIPPPPSPSSHIPSVPPPAPMPHQISEARARLRSTGRTLDEIDSQRDIYNGGRVRENSYSVSQHSDNGVPRSSSPPTFTVNFSNNNRYRSPMKDDRDNFGSSTNYVNSSTQVGRSQSFHTPQYNDTSRTWRARSPQPEAPPRQTKGRSRDQQQPAQFSTLQHPKKADKLFKLFSKFSLKHDDDGSKTKKSNDRWLKKNRDSSNDNYGRNGENGYSDNNVYTSQGSTKFSAQMAGKYSSDEAPVPPPRTKRRQPRPQTTYYFGQESETSGRSSRQRPHSIYANISFSDDRGGRDREDRYNSKYDMEHMNRKNDYYSNSKRSDTRYYRDNSNDRYDSGYGDPQDSYEYGRGRRAEEEYEDRRGGRRSDDRGHRRSGEDRKRGGQRRGHKEDKNNRRSSPSAERRYKTTKTITPVYVMESKQPKHQYRSMDVLNTSNYNDNRNSYSTTSPSWTQTLESKKKQRQSDDYARVSSTLPRKTHQSTYSPSSKTYLYGTDDTNTYSSRARNASMLNVNSYDEPTTNSTSVLRSHSLNVRPVTTLSSLRSPNLIASIARTNSTRHLDARSSDDLLSKDLYEKTEQDDRHFQRDSPIHGGADDKRSRFMEGLLSTAPELYRFIHGGDGEDTVDNSKTRSGSPPRLERPLTTSPPPAPLNAPKVFTFGRAEGSVPHSRVIGSTNTSENMNGTNITKTNFSTNSMGRTSSGYDSGTYSTNSTIRRNNQTNGGSSLFDSNGNRRQSAFNMKTEGSSLLYSPSFRERQDELRKERQKLQREAELAGKRANMRAAGVYPDADNEDQHYWGAAR